MGWLISSNKILLEALQLKIHNYMLVNVENYNAERWANIIKHSTENNFAILIKESDPRLPFRAITNSEKLSLVDELPNGWIKETIISS